LQEGCKKDRDIAAESDSQATFSVQSSQRSFRMVSGLNCIRALRAALDLRAQRRVASAVFWCQKPERKRGQLSLHETENLSE